jgi:hypothetical protein
LDDDLGVSYCRPNSTPSAKRPAEVTRNEWETFMVILGLIIIGLGQGALATLLFNTLAAASPKELAGEVGSLRGTDFTRTASAPPSHRRVI